MTVVVTVPSTMKAIAITALLRNKRWLNEAFNDLSKKIMVSSLEATDDVTVAQIVQKIVS